MKHQHKEAFCHMKYACQSSDGRKNIEITIWNSRDGVTPFCFVSKEFNIELVHVNWEQDVYDPNYLPKPGDLIWRDYSKSDAIDAALKELKQYQEIIDVTPFSKHSEQPYKALIDALSDQDKHITESIKGIVGSKQPKLDIIKQTLPCPVS